MASKRDKADDVVVGSPQFPLDTARAADTLDTPGAGDTFDIGPVDTAWAGRAIILTSTALDTEGAAPAIDTPGAVDLAAEIKDLRWKTRRDLAISDDGRSVLEKGLPISPDLDLGTMAIWLDGFKVGSKPSGAIR